ncbi:MAG: riboflavin synthase [Truepera sp.]|nr:riboflavin synthase [Truepera sp.]
MFTGIVEETGRIVKSELVEGNLRVTIEANQVLEGMQLGTSIAVSGCCLTVITFNKVSFQVELSQESVAKTAPRWHMGARVNLERAMRADDRFGGHLVSGHVETTGTVLAVEAAPGAYIITVRADPRLAKYLIPKGSITVDGVSMTVVDVGGPGGSQPDWAAGRFTLWVIPHTLEVTTLGELTAGSLVNLEADLLAKYLERLMLMREAAA